MRAYVTIAQSYDTQTVPGTIHTQAHAEESPMSAPLTPLQSAADATIRSWPDVRAKQVFGHRGFVHNGKMFAFFAEDGLAFKAETLAAAEELYTSGAAAPFIYNTDMEMRAWPVLPLPDDAHLSAALGAAWEAYERT
jgi:TfoX/Sxy family transcriptional regulator of competence genes